MAVYSDHLRRALDIAAKLRGETALAKRAMWHYAEEIERRVEQHAVRAKARAAADAAEQALREAGAREPLAGRPVTRATLEAAVASGASFI